MATVRPGTKRASVWATWANVLWSSLRTITRHSPPRALPGPSMRGSSTVSDTVRRLAVSPPDHTGHEGCERPDPAQDLGVAQALQEDRADDLPDRQRALLGRRGGRLRRRGR